MRRQKGDAHLFFVFGVIFGILLLVASCSSLVSCKASWGKSGLNTSWGFFQGCLVEVEPGRWIPEDKVREIDVKPQKK